MSGISRRWLAALTALVGISIAPQSIAQSSDGYHSIQVFPLVVDTTSFTQRFYFTNPTLKDVVMQAIFLPAEGTAQAAIGPLSCLPTAIPGSGDREIRYYGGPTPPPNIGATTVASLRDLCPGLPAGSAFGMLYTWEQDPESLPYAGFSRISNPQGIGFTVEAFPAHTFTGADTVITGLRRLMATPGSPAYQTNCFVGNLNFVTPDPPQDPRNGSTGSASVAESYALFRQNETIPFASGGVNLPPGKIVRLLDVFAAAGAPAGDYDNVSIRFRHVNENPALVTFCTVQENTSYSADFRIGKQEWSPVQGGIATADLHVVRNSPESPSQYWALKGQVDHEVNGRSFQIAAGPSNANTHFVMFRHPDYVSCSLRDQNTGAVLDPSYGLEMRLLRVGYSGLVVAGGNAVTAFGEVFLGDKHDDPAGANNFYTIEVESRDNAATAPLPYALKCSSGSGHPNWFLLTHYQEPADRF